MPWFVPTATVSDPLPVQMLSLRQGDRLPSFATVIQDQYGVALDISNARCFLTLRPLNVPNNGLLLDRVELTVEDAVNGFVSYDWQAGQTLGASPGVYDVMIEVEYLTGNKLTVPSDGQTALVTLRSSIAGDYFLTDTTGKLLRQSGQFVPFNPLLLQTGAYRLLEDGTYLLMETP